MGRGDEELEVQDMLASLDHHSLGELIESISLRQDDIRVTKIERTECVHCVD